MSPDSDKGNGKERLAAVLLRGRSKFSPDVRDALDSLQLKRKNSCVIMEDNPSSRGMLAEVNNCVAWGEVDEEMVEELTSERGEADEKHFRLHPPRGGLERKGIKALYDEGGALGYRGDDINDLLRRML